MHFDWIHAGAILLIALTLGVSALGAVLIWRNGYVRGWRASRASPPICPNCRYDLSGLRQCRCPECGTEYRLDDLWRTAVVTARSDALDAPREADRTDANRPESKNLAVSGDRASWTDLRRREVEPES